jgi:hypothetical protein
MKNLRKQSLVAIGGLAMIMNAGAASSSTTHAFASIDWSTFSITGFGLGSASAPSYSLTGQGSNTSSNISDWVKWRSDVANTGSLFGVSTEGTGAGSGSASAQRNARLAISGSGFLVISADYLLSAAINGISCTDYYCYDQNSASASVGFSLSNYSSNGSHSSVSQPGISLGNSWNSPNSGLTADRKEGVLSVGVIVNDGDILNFSSVVSAFAHDTGVNSADSGFGSMTGGAGFTLVNFPYPNVQIAAVPVPAAVWLFGSALLGVVGLGRQKRVLAA